MIADDLFAGAGGWDLAAAQLGIRARGVENMPEARATREAAGLTTIHDDVWTFKPDGTATGLIASPPCQTFSAAGKGAGRKALDDVLGAIWNGAHLDIDALRDVGEQVGDARTALVLTPLHFAMTGGYEWLAWEQVPTVLPVWQACVEVLRAAGWKAWAGLAQAEMYGVPQTRKRAFLIASRHGIGEARPTHSRYYARNPSKLDAGVEKWVSMAEALGWNCGGECAALRNNNTVNAAVRPGSTPAPTLYFGQRCNYCAWEMVSNYGSGGDASNRGIRQSDEPSATVTSKIDRNVIRSAMVAAGISGAGSPRHANEPAATITGKGTAYWLADADDYTGPAQVRPPWCWARPSTTIVGSFRPEVVAAPGYRTTVSRQNAPDSVRVTVQEAGVLQSFPADYPWQGAKGKQFLQCGNAIPPGLALPALAAATGAQISDLSERTSA